MAGYPQAYCTSRLGTRPGGGQNSFYVAISASADAAAGGVTACQEDFRGNLATISIPVLVRSLTAISQPSHRLEGQRRTQAYGMDIRRTLTCGCGLWRTGRTHGIDLRI